MVGPCHDVCAELRAEKPPTSKTPMDVMRETYIQRLEKISQIRASMDIDDVRGVR